MAPQITIDSAGRVLIPKALRRSLRLESGDKLRVEAEGDAITLHPVRQSALLRKQQGLWVFSGEPVGDEPTEDWIDRDRQNRIRDIIGTATQSDD